MKKQQGFTLIELVVVIIILGILAVTAAPKFINLQSDARASALDGLKGALQGANSLIYSKAALQGLQNSDGSTTPVEVRIGGTDAAPVNVDTSFGYMTATSDALDAGADLDLGEDGQTPANTNEWLYTTGTNSITIRQNGAPTANCSLVYNQVTALGNTPVITVTTTGC